MKRIILILFLVILGRVGSAESIGRFFIGPSLFLHNGIWDCNDEGLSETGSRLGFLLPLNLPLVDAHLKFVAGRHIYSEPETYYTSFVYGTNELLVGKEFMPLEKLSILPQAGFGLFGQLDYKGRSAWNGIFDLFGSASCIMEWHFDRFNLGTMVDYCEGIQASGIAPSTRRLGISLIVSK